MQGNDAVGIALAVFTAATWAITPIMYASIGRKIGAWPANLLRMAIAGIFYVLACGGYLLVRGEAVVLPTWPQVGWLTASSLTGMAIGDWAYFEALVRLGPRRTIQLQVLAPVWSLLIAWAWLGEALAARELLGAGLVLAGVATAVTAERPDQPSNGSREPGKHSATGAAWAVLGGIGMALGAVFTRRAFLEGPEIDRLFATGLRIVPATLVLWAVAAAMGLIPRTVAAWSDATVRRRAILASLLGPGIAMIAYVMALGMIPAGLVSTVVAASPLITLPVVAVKYRARIPWQVWLGMIGAVAGVIVLSAK